MSDTPKEQRILGQKATLFKDGPRPVYLLPDGRFAVDNAGKWVVKNTLAAVLKASNKPARMLKVFTAADGYRNDDSPTLMVEFKDGLYREKGDVARRRGSYRTFYLWDAKAVASLNELADRKQAALAKFHQEYQKIVDGLTTVHERNFEAMLKEHGDDAT